MADYSVSMCLPKGDMMGPLAELFESVDFQITDYHSKNRAYRPAVTIPESDIRVRAKIMHEKDIALQVAVGNYDIGCCGFDWIEEHRIRYKTTNLHPFKPLELGNQHIFVCSGQNGPIQTVDDLKQKSGFVVFITEYPNLAEHFAVTHRLPKFKVFTAWGSAEAYPPEHADIVVLKAKDAREISQMGLTVIEKLFTTDLWVVVNRESFSRKNCAPVLKYFSQMRP